MTTRNIYPRTILAALAALITLTGCDESRTLPLQTMMPASAGTSASVMFRAHLQDPTRVCKPTATAKGPVSEAQAPARDCDPKSTNDDSM